MQSKHTSFGWLWIILRDVLALISCLFKQQSELRSTEECNWEQDWLIESKEREKKYQTAEEKRSKTGCWICILNVFMYMKIEQHREWRVFICSAIFHGKQVHINVLRVALPSWDHLDVLVLRLILQFRRGVNNRIVVGLLFNVAFVVRIDHIVDDFFSLSLFRVFSEL